MTTSTRSEFLAALAELSDLDPQLRPGQLVANIATLTCGTKVEAVWDAEDPELLAAARRLVAWYRSRNQQVA